ncbi:transglycosylase domain-containing protein [Alteripontixanthobacter maritimus]
MADRAAAGYDRPAQPDEAWRSDYSYDPAYEYQQDPYAPASYRTGWRRFVPVLGKRSRWWWLRKGLVAGFVLFLALVAWLAFTAPLSKSLEPLVPPQITLLAADGTPIARKGSVVDQPVQAAALPDHVIEPFLAIEDRRFYSHWGIDPRGLGRAVWANVSGGRVEGGSTITQQLAKFTFLTPERSMTRKAREMLIAFWLETWLTKDEILERYLSNAYFGDNVYGLRAASLHYFYRQPEKLKPAQAAMLAGLVQAPSRLNPVKHYARAEKRMRLVIGSMVAAGYITQGEADAMAAPRLDVRTESNLPTGTYFADWALPQARKLAGGGYARQTMSTTLDARLQSFARKAVGRAKLGEAQVALVAMRTNGEIVAMVGGKDYKASAFNRVTQAKRQPGSTFKLFVYLAALREGWEPEDTIDNSEIVKGSYRPKNARGRYSPTITLEDGLAQSSNVAAVRLLREVGDEAVIETARDLGVTAPLAKGDPSLALGTSNMTLLELTAAYAGVAANRFPVEPTAFPAEEPGWLDWLTDGKDSISGSDQASMERMLRSAINRGTGRAAMLPGPNYGKTGTTQDNRDALFVGYAGELVVGVWIGNDDNSSLGAISGGTTPARIWRDFMRQAQGLGAPKAPAPAPRPSDPGGPVEPMDVPDLDDIPDGDIPLGNGDARMRVEDDAVTVSTEIDGLPIELRVDQDGFRVSPAPGQPPTPRPPPDRREPADPRDRR